MLLQNKLLILLFIGLNYCAIAQKTDDISQFDWLLGKWKYEDQNSSYEENWKKVDDQKLEAMVFSINGTDTLLREHFRIEKIDNQWTFIGIVENQAPSFFTLLDTKMKNKQLTFEKKVDSFPKQISYAKKEDLLVVWVTGDLNGQPMKLEYPMKKIELHKRVRYHR